MCLYVHRKTIYTMYNIGLPSNFGSSSRSFKSFCGRTIRPGNLVISIGLFSSEASSAALPNAITASE